MQHRRKKKSRAGLWILLVALLAAGGAGGWFFTQPKDRQAEVRLQLALLWRDFRAWIAPPDSPDAALAGIRPARADIAQAEAEASGKKAREGYQGIEGVKQVPGIDAPRLRMMAEVRLKAGETELTGQNWPMAHAYFEASLEASDKIRNTDKHSIDAFNRRNAAYSLRDQLNEKPHPKLTKEKLDAAKERMDEADLAFEAANFAAAAKAYMEAAYAYVELKSLSDQLFRYDDVRTEFVAALGKTNQDMLARYGGAAWKEIQELQAQGDALNLESPADSLAAFERALQRLPAAVRMARRAKALETYNLNMQAGETAQAAGDHSAAIKAFEQAFASGHDKVSPALTGLAKALAASGQPSGWPLTLPLEDDEVIELVYILPGSFRMGVEGGDADERPVREIKIEKPFFLARTETTIGQWSSVMPRYPGASAAKNIPANNILWEESVTYASTVSTLRDLKIRLPTEVEWEFACRAGTATRFNFGDDENTLPAHGNFCDAECVGRNSGEIRRDGHSGLAPVRSYPANAWGLHDMHGNVMEWCADRYNPGAYSGTPLPPEIEGSFLVLRGGSYNFPAGLSASGRRYRNLEQVTNDYIGFRVLLEIP